MTDVLTSNDADESSAELPVIGECSACNENIYEGERAYQYRPWGSEFPRGLRTACGSCADEMRSCDACMHRSANTETFSTYTYASRYCWLCLNSQGAQCTDCGRWIHNADFPSEDVDQCENCYECECGRCDCYRCYPEGCTDDECFRHDSHRLIHNYSYRPDFRFYDADGFSRYPTEGIPYFGLELEIGLGDNIGEASHVVTQAAPDFIYLKEDGTVDGFELVTHPMTFAAAKECIPFEALRVLRESFNASAYRHGIHVHVSRAGFASDLHVFKWMKLFYRNANDVVRIARRNSREWASFDPINQQRQILTAEKTLGKRSGAYYAPRYCAINTTNTSTLEVRVFRGSLRRDEILAAIGLVAASVEYTRDLSTNDIRRNGGWTWGAFIAWVRDQGDTYADLLTVNDRAAGERVAA